MVRPINEYMITRQKAKVSSMSDDFGFFAVSEKLFQLYFF